jgi:hypothetical protein
VHIARHRPQELTHKLKHTEVAFFFPPAEGRHCTRAPSAAVHRRLQVSLEERTKFKEETYSNVDGRRRTRALDDAPAGEADKDQWLCATLLVATEGKVRRGGGGMREC